ncbi:HNH endonuclease [Flavobacterium haoranii]|uniref:HNH endonuclease n=1 Tax=Flavobacterium haoranii TaxID=683124 RepID=A0A1M6DDA5_9FLAO|nr:HNH endonuclease [Flavobacterium haoranii]SHI71135.1 HNH endonuclease [Flavobacterium haoranii]
MGHFIAEEWRDLDAEYVTAKKYFVSNLGRIKSCFRDDEENCTILKGGLTDGFPRISFSVIQKEGKAKQKHVLIHHLVAKLFIPKANNEALTHVIHLDFDRKNNRVDNLKWVTREEMFAHVHKSPVAKESLKKVQEFNRQSNGHKLTVTEVIRLKKKLLDPNRKTRYKILAKQFGVSMMALQRIKTGENWGHIKVEFPEKPVIKEQDYDNKTR